MDSTKKISLSDICKEAYCQSDFRELLRDWKQADARMDEQKRKNIKEVLDVMLGSIGIKSKRGRTYRYYEDIFNRLIETDLKSFHEMESEILQSIYLQWKSEQGIALRDSMSVRDEEFQNKDVAYDYYVNFFIFLKDDVSRLGGATFSTQELWFTDTAAVIDRLTRSLHDRAEKSGDIKEVESFVRSMYNLEGLINDQRDMNIYDATTISRNMILWLVFELLIAEKECYKTEEYQPLPIVMKRLKYCADGQLATGGFQTVHYDNPMDAYLAFSLYLKINGSRVFAT